MSVSADKLTNYLVILVSVTGIGSKSQTDNQIMIFSPLLNICDPQKQTYFKMNGFWSILSDF